MNDFKKRLEYIKWLKHIGIEYYFSEKKDSENYLIEKINQLNSSVKEVNNNQDVISISKNRHYSVSNNEINKNKNSFINNQELENKANLDIKPIELTKMPTKTNSVDSRELADKANNIDELKKLVTQANCDLKHFANNTVFSDGVKEADIMLIGEAPGASEDLQAIPFCGESGMLLDKMLATIGISRNKNAYITNTVFWRPPANRRPTNEELNICRPLVEKHIALIKPKLIILVGGTATTSLLGKNEGISYLRKNIYYYKNQYLEEPIQTTAIFHPAYLLRQPMQKKNTWYDLLRIKEVVKNLECYNCI